MFIPATILYLTIVITCFCSVDLNGIRPRSKQILGIILNSFIVIVSFYLLDYTYLDTSKTLILLFILYNFMQISIYLIFKNK